MHRLYSQRQSEDLHFHKKVSEQEAAGKTFVICPETSLGISRTEKDPDELQRVYDLGRAEMLKRLDELKAFLA